MSPILLAYSGGRASSVALHGLVETHGASVVTLTLDVGQGADLAELRERALSGGAVRAHAIDAREELARDVVLPLVGGGALGGSGYPDIEALARPLMASKLVEVARIEGARVVAHGSAGAEIDDAIHALDPDLTVLAPVRGWPSGGSPAGHARRRGLTPRRQAGRECRVEQNLWGRTVSWRDGDLAPDEAR
ncbi:MAG TPA: argininosuccinate synthase domain-containing protein, partial [Pseudomonadales bacterium]|nr:argininosuccinate synthase domain-containing protein [Pseudomonadales bacterium]